MEVLIRNFVVLRPQIRSFLIFVIILFFDQFGTVLLLIMQSKLTQTKFIYWFAYYNLDSPSVRYRAKYPLDYLKKKYDVDSYLIMPGYGVLTIFNFIRAYISALLFCKENSVIVIQRIHSGFIYASLLKILVKIRPSRTYYDLDDADYLEYPPKSIYYFLKNCSGSFLGSRELVKNLSHLNSNTILNTSPTPDAFYLKRRRNSPLTVGWIGDFGGGHKEALLKYFFPALLDLDFRVRFILLGVGRKDESDFDFITKYFGSNPNIIPEMPREINWNDEKQIQHWISQFDIGVATLLENEFHLSKSAFKLKQYLNNGVPVLSSNLPENTFFVQNGINGFLCDTSSDFRNRIIEINKMSDSDYMRLSDCARKSSTDFNLEIYCNTLITRKGQPLEPKLELRESRTFISQYKTC